jgi:hypothetical protein
MDDRASIPDMGSSYRIFLFATASRPALGPNQPPNQLVAGTLTLGVQRTRRESDFSPPRAEVKNA